MQFHLDEHVDHAIARGLRHRGIDVTTSTDAELLHASDEEHLAYALSEGRVTVTNDADFLRLHQQEVEHDGIVFWPRGSRSIGEAIRHLVLMHDCLEESKMRGQVEFL